MSCAYSVGVIIGRFQIDSLSTEHIRLLQYVLGQKDRTLIFLGIPSVQGSLRNPLDFQTRAAMINNWLACYTVFLERVTVLPLHDKESDLVWSQQIDRTISMCFPDTKNVTLYHGRDGFGDHYQGRFHKEDLFKSILTRTDITATSRREELGKTPIKTEDFRRGVIYASQHQWSHVKAAVDIIVTRHEQVLLGRKESEATWRLPGGLVDPEDDSYEIAVRRELLEETNLIIEGPLDYVCSSKIHDWRYRGLTNEGIVSTCFTGEFTMGIAQAGDDLKEVSWATFTQARENLRPEHFKLFNSFLMKKGLQNE